MGNRDCSYFKKLGREESIRQLNSHHTLGDQLEFIKKVAPDYVQEVFMSATLANDARLFISDDDAKKYTDFTGAYDFLMSSCQKMKNGNSKTIAIEMEIVLEQINKIFRAYPL